MDQMIAVVIGVSRWIDSCSDSTALRITKCNFPTSHTQVDRRTAP